MLALGLSAIVFVSFYSGYGASADLNRRQLEFAATRSFFEKNFPSRERSVGDNSFKPDNTVVGSTKPSLGVANYNSAAVYSDNKFSDLTNSKKTFPNVIGQQPSGSNGASNGLRTPGWLAQNRGLALTKGDSGSPLPKTSGIHPFTSYGSSIIGGVSTPLNSLGVQPTRDPYGSPAIPIGQPAFQTPSKTLSKSYGLPKAKYGSPKAAYGVPKLPSKGYGVPTKSTYGLPQTGYKTPILGSSIGTSPLTVTGPVPLRPTGPVSPNDPVLADPGLVGILNSPPPYLSPLSLNKNPITHASGIAGNGPLSVPLQRPPLQGSGLGISLLDLPLETYGGINSGNNGPAIPTGTSLYPPLGDSPVDSPVVPQLFDGPHSAPLPGGAGYEGGLSDDVGHVSSFSYFRSPEFAKDLDYRFLDANRIISEQFYLHMTDRTGFPGVVRFRELDENTARAKTRSNEIVAEKGAIGQSKLQRPKTQAAINPKSAPQRPFLRSNLNDRKYVSQIP